MDGMGHGFSRLVMLCAAIAILAGALAFAFTGGSDPRDPSMAMHAEARGAHDMHQMTCPANDADCSMPVDHDAHAQHADCAMTVCCVSDLGEHRLDLTPVAVTARYACITPDPVLQADPDRADDPPRRT